MSTENKHRKQHTLKTAVNIITAVFWGAFIIICLVNRDKITVDSIVSFTPSNIFLAIGVMLLLYAVKSVSVFIYGGLLYAACGIMFDLPLAIIINTAGTVIMTSVPYFIGKKAGKGLVEKLIQKKPKLEAICRLPAKNGFFVSFLVRMIGLLPADFVGMYLGVVKNQTAAVRQLAPQTDPLIPGQL